MIRITSIEQALSLRGTIPELAIIRALQFMGDGYSTEEHGHIIVFEQGDDPTLMEEVGTNGLFDGDNLPTYEFVEAFVDGDSVVFEIVFALDSERTVAVIAEQSTLDAELRNTIQKLSTPPQPFPTLNRRIS